MLCMCLCGCGCIHVYACVCTCAWVCACVRVCMCVRICVTLVCACMHTYVCACTFVCTPACACIRTCIDAQIMVSVSVNKFQLFSKGCLLHQRRKYHILQTPLLGFSTEVQQLHLLLLKKLIVAALLTGKMQYVICMCVFLTSCTKINQLN